MRWPCRTLPLRAALLAAFLVPALSAPLQAQDAGDGSDGAAQTAAPADENAAKRTSMRELIESEKLAEEVIREKKSEIGQSDGLPRTPLQLMALIADAMQRGDAAAAAELLDMRYVPEEVAAMSPENLIYALRVVWSQQNIVDLTQLSDEPQGRQNDDLPPYRDLLGMISLDDGSEVPVYLQRIPDGQGGKMWKISNASVAEIPALWADLGYGPIAVWLQRHLPSYRFAGLESWQLIAGAMFLVAAWYLSLLVSVLLQRLALLASGPMSVAVAQFLRGPLRLFLFVLIFRLLMDQLALSLVARVYLNSSGVDYIAYAILILGIISLVRDYNIRRLERAGNRQYVALLKPFTTIVKFLALTVMALIWAERAGYNMSTIIAGLGVTSLAVALAAQKTLENVIGAITLYSARPVNPGDLCRFGDVVGVVEEIGLRSTMIRTLDRTMLAVPNSVFSSVEVENFSHRDRIRYYRHLELQMATADQLRVILGRLRELLLSHADVLQETVSVRLEKIVAATAVIRIDAGIDTTDYQRFLAIAEDLNLRTIELVHDAGAVFSGPGQVLQLRDFQQASEGKMAEIERQLGDWETQSVNPFPDFTSGEKASLKGRIELPAREDPS